MRGKPGTEVTLTIVRDGVEKPFKIVVTRSVIKTRSVRSLMLDDGYGYLRITQFQSKTGAIVIKQVNKLMKASNGKLNGLIIDLRNNPGGVLNASVSVSDAFLEKGKIVYTNGRVADSKLEFNATEGDIIKGAPIVVLVNGGSASASEIVAGALQDHKRAIIMGEKTFGKGSVQTILPSRGGTAVKLTTARYYTPSGRSIQAEGIEPDITVESLHFKKKKQADVIRLKEKDLSRHLEGSEKKKKGKKVKLKLSARAKNMLTKDYQVFEALNLLKALRIASVTKSKMTVKPAPAKKEKKDATKAKPDSEKAK
jgi:carboxyl-terminal processing protease